MNSVEKTITILKILGQKPYVYGVTELGEKIECGKSGTFKILSVLLKNGFVSQTPEHKYTLGIATYLLGKQYEEHIGVLNFVKPFMKELRDETGETITFGMLVNGHPTSICRVEGTRMVRVMDNLGGTRPINAGAIGRLLSAYLSEEDLKPLLEEELHAYTDLTLTDPAEIIKDLRKIREQEYVICDGDFSLDTITFGAPVKDSTNKIWAALVLSAPRIRIDEETKSYYLEKVRATAKKISDAL